MGATDDRMARIEIRFDNAEKIIEEMRARSERDIAEIRARSERDIAEIRAGERETRAFVQNAVLAMAGVVFAAIAMLFFRSDREHDRMEARAEEMRQESREHSARFDRIERRLENIEKLILDLHGVPAVRTSAGRRPSASPDPS